MSAVIKSGGGGGASAVAALTDVQLAGLAAGHQLYWDGAKWRNRTPGVAHVADSTSAGGNDRGSGAVDWQTVRSQAYQVAEAAQSVVAGGQSNRAHGVQSAVGGGLANVAWGDNSAIPGGQNNTATGTYGTAWGINCSASGQNATAGGGACTASANGAVALGQNNTASGNYSAALGANNTADADFSFVPGGQYATTRGSIGRSAWSNGRFAAQGDSQASDMVLRATTTDATATKLTSDGGAAGALNQYVVGNNSSALVRVQVAARTAVGDKAVFDINAFVRRDANAAGTTVTTLGTPLQGLAGTNAANWTCTVSADTVNGGLAITVVGTAGLNVRWTARLTAVETVFP